MAEKRSRRDIIVDMLISIVNKGGKIKPTHLMYKSNLSHIRMRGYLEELVQKEMVKKTTNRNFEYILITEKGHDFMGKLRELKELEKTFGL